MLRTPAVVSITYIRARRDPTKTNSPGTATGFNEGADALPGGLPKRDDNHGDTSDNLMNDQGGGLAALKGM